VSFLVVVKLSRSLLSVVFAILFASLQASAQTIDILSLTSFRLQQIPFFADSQRGSEEDCALPFTRLPSLDSFEIEYVDRVLAALEQQCDRVNCFECTFNRFVFNAAVHPTNPESCSEGMLCGRKPNYWQFKEDKRVTMAGRKPDGSPDYKENPAAPHGDWWVCDGEWVHNLDRREKKAVRTQLPPQLRGNNNPLSPLPFLFGVKAAEVKARYYVRGLTPPPGSNDVWIEAWPKRADDAGNYSRVQVALDKKDSLPNAMIMFMPNWANNAQNREVFNFAQREVNSNNLLDKIKQNIFMKSFIETNVPNDWNVIQEPWVPPQVQQQVQAAPGTPNGPPVQQATAPAQQQLKR
jgi:TIGR03009 family protein